MLIHNLKTLPEFFEAIADGRKNFEARKKDRNFNVADILILEEWNPGHGYTGRTERRDVDFILEGKQFGVRPGYCVMSISKRAE